MRDSALTAALKACRAAGRPILVPFLTGGFPDRVTFRALLLEAQAQGADAVEIGVPFSDPCADGPVIQEISRRSLANGTRLPDIFADLAQARSAGFALPVILMTYLNPVLSFSGARLAREAKRTGVDGLLVVDLPPEEFEEALGLPQEAPLDRIVMVSPTTTTARLPLILERARGFVYCVSMTGVTGAQGASVETAGKVVALARTHSELPALVGFGISSPQAARQISRVSDGVIVGSALLAAMGEKRGRPAVEAAGSFLGRMRAALDGGPDCVSPQQIPAPQGPALTRSPIRETPRPPAPGEPPGRGEPADRKARR